MFFLFPTIGCKKIIEVDAPATSLTSGNVFSSDETAISFLNGIYTNFGQEGSGILLLPVYTGLSSDELRVRDELTFETFVNHYKNTLFASGATYNYWTPAYYTIYRCNAGIEGLNASSKLTLRIKQQLLGEVKFMRALMYINLLNIYGNVPLVVSTDLEVNRKVSRTPATEVYDQVILDLKEAKDLLSSSYLEKDLVASSSTTSRIRPTKWAALALLARACVYAGRYPEAETASSEVIANTTLFSLPTLPNAFLATSREAIFQIQPTSSAEYNTIEGNYLLLSSSGPELVAGPRAFYLNSPLLSAFESGDPRRVEWVGSVTPMGSTTTYFYPRKYRLGNPSVPGIEYSMILRLAEQFLIRAEARIKQGGAKIADGIADLNAVRTRSRNSATAQTPNLLPDLSLAMGQEDAMRAVWHERQVEFFAEGGHRWFDLKRSGKIDETMMAVSIVKGSIWQGYQQLYPIPPSELSLNPSLRGSQNPGYQ